MRWIAGLALGALFSGCSGKEEEGCDTFNFEVTVLDVEGGLVTDAIVELNNVECANNGDGTYTCPADMTPDRYNLAAIHPAYNVAAQNFDELPESFCDGVPVELQLGVMMGA